MSTPNSISNSAPDGERLEDRVDALESRVAAGETAADRRDDRLDELDAGLQAVRGFLGGVDAVNEAVERRANAALSTVERLERAVESASSDAESDCEAVAAVAAAEARPSDGSDEDTGNPPTTTGSLRDRLRSLR